MARKFLIKSFALLALALWALPVVSLPTFAQTTTPPANTNGAKDATSVNGCASQKIGDKYYTPSNCLFLEEPIGGKPNLDLYTSECATQPDASVQCVYTLWNGGAITGNVRGPLQAVLTRQAGKEAQGSLGLLYNYLSLIYTYMSGLIIGVSVLFVVIGGIQIATSHGEEGVNQGKSRIIKAITGIILWFTASLILYTINPTFFAF
jgi:hypothetical protein